MSKPETDTPYVERQGGSYIRDPNTGELRNELDVQKQTELAADQDTAATKSKKGE